MMHFAASHLSKMPGEPVIGAELGRDWNFEELEAATSEAKQALEETWSTYIK